MYKLSERNLVIKFYKCLEHAFCVLKSFLNFVGKTRSFFCYEREFIKHFLSFKAILRA